ncbi:thioredoxin family protein [Pedobacter sp. AW31-3R]|uniref:thioredoxin family protein n=1 Tax=Pedobacter sp. AW31-3R TaxID=3445781 RepID=UPI003FA17368
MINYSNIFVNEGLSYSAYRNLVSSLLENHQTTGEDHSEAMLHYSKMNVQRMNRVDKTVSLNEELVQTLDSVKKKYRLLVISEGWCGDAAQLLPLFQKIVDLAPELFDLRVVLRDHNLPLIDAHLTNGGRAIPKLLVIDEEGGLVTEWGPRPDVLQQLLNVWKTENSDMFVLAEMLHHWYAKDKTQTTQKELVSVFKNLEQLV